MALPGPVEPGELLAVLVKEEANIAAAVEALEVEEGEQQKRAAAAHVDKEDAAGVTGDGEGSSGGAAAVGGGGGDGGGEGNGNAAGDSAVGETKAREGGEVGEWLKGLDVDLRAYEAALAEDGFDCMVSVMTLNEDDLDSLGVKKGHRRILLAAIALRKEEEE